MRLVPYSGPAEAYITPGADNVSFRTIGSSHLHLDAPPEYYGALRAVIHRIEETLKIPSKINLVHGFIAGPQRASADFGEFYNSHTPGNTREEFGVFSTTLLPEDRNAVITALELMKKHFAGTGAVAEFEQIVGRGETDRRWHELRATRLLEPLSKLESRLDPWPTQAYEIHHGVNVEGEEQPVTLEELVRVEGTEMGGWFLSKRTRTGHTIWAYRSNAFDRKPKEQINDVDVRVRREASLLEEFFASKGVTDPKVSTTLEATLNVWKF